MILNVIKIYYLKSPFKRKAYPSLLSFPSFVTYNYFIPLIYREPVLINLLLLKIKLGSTNRKEKTL